MNKKNNIEKFGMSISRSSRLMKKPVTLVLAGRGIDDCDYTKEFYNLSTKNCDNRKMPEPWQSKGTDYCCGSTTYDDDNVEAKKKKCVENVKAGKKSFIQECDPPVTDICNFNNEYYDYANKKCVTRKTCGNPTYTKTMTPTEIINKLKYQSPDDFKEGGKYKNLTHHFLNNRCVCKNYEEAYQVGDECKKRKECEPYQFARKKFDEDNVCIDYCNTCPKDGCKTQSEADKYADNTKYLKTNLDSTKDLKAVNNKNIKIKRYCINKMKESECDKDFFDFKDLQSKTKNNQCNTKCKKATHIGDCDEIILDKEECAKSVDDLEDYAFKWVDIPERFQHNEDTPGVLGSGRGTRRWSKSDNLAWTKEAEKYTKFRWRNGNIKTERSKIKQGLLKYKLQTKLHHSIYYKRKSDGKEFYDYNWWKQRYANKDEKDHAKDYQGCFLDFFSYQHNNKNTKYNILFNMPFGTGKISDPKIEKYLNEKNLDAKNPYNFKILNQSRVCSKFQSYQDNYYDKDSKKCIERKVKTCKDYENVSINDKNGKPLLGSEFECTPKCNFNTHYFEKKNNKEYCIKKTTIKNCNKDENLIKSLDAKDNPDPLKDNKCETACSNYDDFFIKYDETKKKNLCYKRTKCKIHEDIFKKGDKFTNTTCKDKCKGDWKKFYYNTDKKRCMLKNKCLAKHKKITKHGNEIQNNTCGFACKPNEYYNYIKPYEWTTYKYLKGTYQNKNYKKIGCQPKKSKCKLMVKGKNVEKLVKLNKETEDDYCGFICGDFKKYYFDIKKNKCIERSKEITDEYCGSKAEGLSYVVKDLSTTDSYCGYPCDFKLKYWDESKGIRINQPSESEGCVKRKKQKDCEKWQNIKNIGVKRDSVCVNICDFNKEYYDTSLKKCIKRIKCKEYQDTNKDIERKGDKNDVCTDKCDDFVTNFWNGQKCQKRKTCNFQTKYGDKFTDNKCILETCDAHKKNVNDNCVNRCNDFTTYFWNGQECQKRKTCNFKTKIGDYFTDNKCILEKCDKHQKNVSDNCVDKCNYENEFLDNDDKCKTRKNCNKITENTNKDDKLKDTLCTDKCNYEKQYFDLYKKNCKDKTKCSSDKKLVKGNKIKDNKCLNYCKNYKKQYWDNNKCVNRRNICKDYEKNNKFSDKCEDKCDFNKEYWNGKECANRKDCKSLKTMKGKQNEDDDCVRKISENEIKMKKLKKEINQKEIKLKEDKKIYEDKIKQKNKESEENKNKLIKLENKKKIINKEEEKENEKIKLLEEKLKNEKEKNKNELDNLKKNIDKEKNNLDKGEDNIIKKNELKNLKSINDEIIKNNERELLELKEKEKEMQNRKQKLKKEITDIEKDAENSSGNMNYIIIIGTVVFIILFMMLIM